MLESDSTLSLLTALLVISTGAVALATFLVWKATQKMVKVTKETTKLPIMPRMIVHSHNKIGNDEAHDHYEFTFQNLGVGNAFNVKIESLHKEGSRTYTPIPVVAIGTVTKITNKSVDKDAKSVEFIVKYQDYADNGYEKKITYDFESGVDRTFYGGIASREN